MESSLESSANLTVAESDLFVECEATIERGLRTFTEVGQALMSIRDNRLYRAAFPTFEAYCQERWGFDRSRADQLIKAADVTTTVVAAGLPAPANEGQARELARVPESDRAEVWREAVERSEGRPTAEVVRQVRTEREETRQAETIGKEPAFGPNEVRRQALREQAEKDGLSPAQVVRVASSPRTMAAAIKADPQLAEVAKEALRERAKKIKDAASRVPANIRFSSLGAPIGVAQDLAEIRDRLRSIHDASTNDRVDWDGMRESVSASLWSIARQAEGLAELIADPGKGIVTDDELTKLLTEES